MEQILIRNLPAGTKAALRARAKQRNRSLEAQARDILTRALESEPVSIVDLLGTDEGADIEFEPERLAMTARSAQLVKYLLDTNVVSAGPRLRAR